MPAPASNEPTIAAIATPAGPGGIGVIRISGSDAHAILARLFVPSRPEAAPQSHRLTHGWIVDPLRHLPVDEVLAVRMRAPATYTREDVAEIHCHGSYLVLATILDLVLAAGAQAATAGEFTKRAFLNGRIDLSRAEAVAELLDAKTREGMQLAVNQLKGGIAEQVGAIRETLIAARAVIEVAIDFPEDDVEILQPATLATELRQGVEAPLTRLIANAEEGGIFRDGISVVILGRPNVGKSSLLNSLLQEERAIVTPVPGTTRDTIEEYLNIKGMPVRIIDTAGIREHAEEIEEIGIQRAREKVAGADLVLLLVDASLTLSDEDRRLATGLGGRPCLVVANKMDIAPDRKAALAAAAAAFPMAPPPVAISAKTRSGISDLEEAIFATVTGGESLRDPAHACVPNLRHKAALSRALAACRLVTAGLDEGRSADLVSVDLQAALDYLGDIVGETTTEDVLDMIFSRFCIGK